MTTTRGTRGDRTIPVAVLCNPRSGRVRRSLPEVRRRARRLAGHHYEEATEPGEIRGVLETWEDGDPARVLCVVGGDGTVQAVLTALHALKPDPRSWPLLSVLPGGSTNMIAADLGTDGPLPRRLRALEAWGEEAGAKPGAVGEGVKNRTVRAVFLAEEAGGESFCGMFLGIGAVAEGVRFWEEHLKRFGLPETVTSPLVIGRILVSLLLDRETGRGMAPRVAWSLAQDTAGKDRLVFGFVSTLHRLLLGTRPYWGEGSGALHVTLVERKARRFWRNLPRLARGRGGSRLTPENGYLSRNTDRVELGFHGPFIVDGELHRLEEDRSPLMVRALEGVEWLVP